MENCPRSRQASNIFHKNFEVILSAQFNPFLLRHCLCLWGDSIAGENFSLTHFIAKEFMKRNLKKFLPLIISLSTSVAFPTLTYGYDAYLTWGYESLLDREVANKSIQFADDTNYLVKADDIESIEKFDGYDYVLAYQHGGVLLKAKIKGKSESFFAPVAFHKKESDTERLNRISSLVTKLKAFVEQEKEKGNKILLCTATSKQSSTSHFSLNATNIKEADTRTKSEIAEEMKKGEIDTWGYSNFPITETQFAPAAWFKYVNEVEIPILIDPSQVKLSTYFPGDEKSEIKSGLPGVVAVAKYKSDAGLDTTETFFHPVSSSRDPQEAKRDVEFQLSKVRSLLESASAAGKKLLMWTKVVKENAGQRTYIFTKTNVPLTDSRSRFAIGTELEQVSSVKYWGYDHFPLWAQEKVEQNDLNSPYGYLLEPTNILEVSPYFADHESGPALFPIAGVRMRAKVPGPNAGDPLVEEEFFHPFNRGDSDFDLVSAKHAINKQVHEISEFLLLNRRKGMKIFLWAREAKSGSSLVKNRIFTFQSTSILSSSKGDTALVGEELRTMKDRLAEIRKNIEKKGLEKNDVEKLLAMEMGNLKVVSDRFNGIANQLKDLAASPAQDAGEQITKKVEELKGAQATIAQSNAAIAGHKVKIETINSEIKELNRQASELEQQLGPKS